MSVIRNPVLVLAWGLPAVAVAASVASLLLTLRSPESELPEQYHWEGFQLDRDFSQSARARSLAVRATLSGFSARGQCELALGISGPVPETLTLFVAHSTQPQLDQTVEFRRVADSGTKYVGSCRALPESHWRLELRNDQGGWAVRQTIRGSLDGSTIDSVSGTNE
jgi:hypothetical protein